MVGASSGSWTRRASTITLVLASLAVPSLVMFGRVLFQDEQFAFQDAGHFYYPLVQRVQQEWDAGRWPLWAPEASAGTPLLGNPTAAVLYPGKLVFFLLPYPWAMRGFLIGHVVLAFVAMGALLRGWKTSVAGSLLGGLAYAFGVPVLSQTSNMIFLVGAAWTPLGFLAVDRWVRCRRRVAIPGLAVVLALQVLGGDPESAYVTVACAGGYAAGLAAVRSPLGTRRVLRRVLLGLVIVYLGLLGLSWWSAQAIKTITMTPPGEPAPWKPPREALVIALWGIAAVLFGSRVRRGRVSPDLAVVLGSVFGGAVLALAVSGAQLLPILEYTRMSFRAAATEGFHDIYPYSANPLQFLDAIWPNVFGTLEGGYRSWLNALPPKPDSRLWMPSVYLGAPTLVLAVATLGFRNGPPWRAWLSVVAVVSLLASLGYYGSPIFWTRCLPGGESLLGPLEPPFSWQVRHDGQLRDGDGGVYWLLASALPGFGGFRYPPKLLVFWSLSISALAGMGWDRLVSMQSRRVRIIATCLLGASLIALAASWLGAAPLRGWFEQLSERLQPTDEPLAASRAVADIRYALTQGTVAFAVLLGIFALAGRQPGPVGLVGRVGPDR